MIVVVADASTLIALQQIEQLALLQALFEEIFVPPAVAREVAGPGESEAISLALEIHADRAQPLRYREKKGVR